MIDQSNRPYVFISYSSTDGQLHAETLAKSLQKCGCQVFFARHNIPPAAAFVSVLETELARATHLIVILTPGSNHSDWVHREVLTFDGWEKPVIPAYFSDVNPISILLINKNRIDFRPSADYDAAFAELLVALKWECQPTPSWRLRPFMDLGLHVDSKHLRCTTATNTIANAHAIMRDHLPEIRHLVVTENGKTHSPLLGLLSLRNILKNEQREDTGHEFIGEKVQDIMRPFAPIRTGPPNPNFNYLREEDTVETMLQQFITQVDKKKDGGEYFYMTALPIVDSHYNAIGIISFKDVCRGILSQSDRLPIPHDTQLGMILSQPRTATPHKTISEIKMKLVFKGQRDAFILDTEERLLGMIPDVVLIKHEYANPNGLAGDREILVTPDRLKLQSADTYLGDMLDTYIDEAKLYYYFSVVENPDSGVRPSRFLGAVSYLEIFNALLQY